MCSHAKRSPRQSCAWLGTGSVTKSRPVAARVIDAKLRIAISLLLEWSSASGPLIWAAHKAAGPGRQHNWWPQNSSSETKHFNDTKYWAQRVGKCCDLDHSSLRAGGSSARPGFSSPFSRVRETVCGRWFSGARKRAYCSPSLAPGLGPKPNSKQLFTAHAWRRRRDSNPR